MWSVIALCTVQRDDLSLTPGDPGCEILLVRMNAQSFNLAGGLRSWALGKPFPGGPHSGPSDSFILPGHVWIHFFPNNSLAQLWLNVNLKCSGSPPEGSACVGGICTSTRPPTFPQDPPSSFLSSLDAVDVPAKGCCVSPKDTRFFLLSP